MKIHDVSTVLISLIAIAEFVVRLTPTKTDDGAVERIGGLITSLLDSLNIPNRKKGK